MNKIIISRSLLETTLQSLRESDDREKMILWFGRRTDEIKIEKIFAPLQRSTAFSLTIDEIGVADVIREIKETGCITAAQIHTHPHEAFHSHADDALAILSHEGALSLVLPEFAQSTTTENFFKQVAAFSIVDGKWLPVSKKKLKKYLIVWD